MKNVTEDIYYTNFINSKNITELTRQNYKRTLNKFSKVLGIPLEQIVIDCKNQQGRVIEKIINHGIDDDGNQIIEKRIVKFNVNNPDSLIKQYMDKFLEFCREQGNSNSTIKQNLMLITSFLKFYNIELPDMETLKKDPKKWYLLEKEDFKYILNDSPLIHVSLIKFLQSSGMRISDALSLSIGDFMEATKDYHDFIDVNDFIDNAPQDMIGTWYFHPQKTMKFQVPCLTFNDPETSNLILQHLRKLKQEYIPYAKKKYNYDKVISKKDALFGSQKSKYIEPLHPNPTGTQFWVKNKKLREWHIAKIDEAIKKGELSIEDREKEISKIPKFHAHACRKYFESTNAKKSGDLRICTLMEGHVSPIATDSSYIKQDIEKVREAYLAAIPDFSLENTKVKLYTSDVRSEMESKISKLESMNEQLIIENENLKNDNSVTNKRIDDLEKIVLGGIDSEKLSKLHKLL